VTRHKVTQGPAKPASSASKDATTHTSIHDDGKFRRTALVIVGRDTGSVDVVMADGTRLCQINISFLPSPSSDGRREALIVDVIDVDNRYPERRALAFSNTERAVIDVPKGGTLVSVDFRKDKEPT
jgi:hypothetical protein